MVKQTRRRQDLLVDPHLAIAMLAIRFVQRLSQIAILQPNNKVFCAMRNASSVGSNLLPSYSLPFEVSQICASTLELCQLAKQLRISASGVASFTLKVIC